KTKYMGRGARQIVTGVVVNKVLGLSRQERRRLRAMAHRLRVATQGDSPNRARFEGKLAYLSMLHAQQAQQVRGRWCRLNRQLEFCSAFRQFRARVPKRTSDRSYSDNKWV